MKAMIGDEPVNETSPISAFLRHIQLLYDESFAASAYCVQYISIACEAANGHTWDTIVDNTSWGKCHVPLSAAVPNSS